MHYLFHFLFSLFLLCFFCATFLSRTRHINYNVTSGRNENTCVFSSVSNSFVLLITNTIDVRIPSTAQPHTVFEFKVEEIFILFVTLTFLSKFFNFFLTFFFNFHCTNWSLFLCTNLVFWLDGFSIKMFGSLISLTMYWPVYLALCLSIGSFKRLTVFPILKLMSNGFIVKSLVF